MIRIMIAAAVAVALCSAGDARAQTYPSKPIHIIVPAAPGGISDLLSRLTADHFDKTFAASGQRALVENKPGAGGNVGVDIVAKAAPDGHWLALIQFGNLGVNPHLFKNMPFDALNDLVPVAPIAASPQLVLVNAKVPATTLKEFIAYAKANPGKINYGSAGVGTSLHLAGELFAHMIGTKMVHVPYRGAAPAVVDLVSGQIQLGFIGYSAVKSQLADKSIHALAVSRATRIKALPDLPTVDEAGLPGFEVVTWFGLVTTKGVPRETVATLNRAIHQMLDDPAVTKRLLDGGMEPLTETPAQFADRIKKDYDKYGAIVKAANIKLE
ncbi:MAG TPA: tripartite tricarboxylate transporter substrate binding protein [Alphaproteobacteria bacterium]